MQSTQHKIMEEPVCPISWVEWTKLKDPVIAEDSHIYERSELKRWLEEKGNSPINRQLMSINKVISAKSFIDSYRSAIEKNELLAKENLILKEALGRLDQRNKFILVAENKQIQKIQDLSIKIEEKERELAAEIFTSKILLKKMQMPKKQVILNLKKEMQKKHEEYKKQMAELSDAFDFNPGAVIDEKQDFNLFEKRHLLDKQFTDEIIRYRAKLRDPSLEYKNQVTKIRYEIAFKRERINTNIKKHTFELLKMRREDYKLREAAFIEAKEKQFNTLNIFGGLKEKQIEVKEIKKTSMVKKINIATVEEKRLHGVTEILYPKDPVEEKKLHVVTGVLSPNDVTEILSPESPVEEKSHVVTGVLSPTEQEKLDNDLFQAIKANDKRSVQNLLNQGAYIEARSKETKSTPLMLAVITFNLDIIKLLLKKGANCNGSFIHNLTVKSHPFLHCQIQYLRDSTPLLALLTSSTVEDKEREKNNKAREAIAVELLKQGAFVNVKNSKGQTALHEAAKTNCPALVKLLLKYNANPTMTNVSGQTALEEARNFLGNNLSQEIVQVLEKAVHDQNMSLPAPTDPAFLKSLESNFSWLATNNAS